MGVGSQQICHGSVLLERSRSAPLTRDSLTLRAQADQGGWRVQTVRLSEQSTEMDRSARARPARPERLGELPPFMLSQCSVEPPHTGRMALGLGPDARHRLGVGRGEWARQRVAAHSAHARAGPGGGALSALVAARVARRLEAPRGTAAARSGGKRCRCGDLSRARGSRGAAFSGQRGELARTDFGGAARGRRGGAAGPLRSLRDLPAAALLSLAPEEQYLIASGRTYFRDLALRRPAAAVSSIWRPPGSTPSAIASSWSPCAAPTDGSRCSRLADGDADEARAHPATGARD